MDDFVIVLCVVADVELSVFIESSLVYDILIHIIVNKGVEWELQVVSEHIPILESIKNRVGFSFLFFFFESSEKYGEKNIFRRYNFLC